jgi:hypothetical protein
MRRPLGVIRDDLTPHVAHFAACALQVDDLDPIGHSTILSRPCWVSFEAICILLVEADWLAAMRQHFQLLLLQNAPVISNIEFY